MKPYKQAVVRIPIREPSVYREPTLEDMLSDSIVKAVMRADAVDPDELGAMLGKVALALRTQSVRRASA